VRFDLVAHLAAALVAYDTFNSARRRLLDVKMSNVVLVLMFTTAILGFDQTFCNKVAARGSAFGGHVNSIRVSSFVLVPYRSLLKGITDRTLDRS